MPVASACRPAMAEETIPGVVCCCFDNLSMKIDYSSYSSEGETGRLLDMTNWFSTRLPVLLAPGFDAHAICECLSARMPTPTPRPLTAPIRFMLVRSLSRYILPALAARFWAAILCGSP